MAKLSAITLIAALVFSVGMLLWLVKTESGLRWALRQAPDILSVSSISGDLSDLSFSDLTLALDGTRVHITSGKLKWSLADLTSKKLTIESTVMSGFNIQLIPSNTLEAEPYLPWAGISLPIDVAIKNLAIDNLIIANDTDEIANLDQLDISLTVTNNLLKVEQFNLTKDKSNVSFKGEIDLSAKADGKVNIANRIQWRDDEKQTSIDGSIIGTWDSLEIKQHSKLRFKQYSPLPFESSLLLNIDNVLTDNISWDGAVKTQANSLQTTNEAKVKIGQGDFQLSGVFSPSMGLPGLIAQISATISAENDQFSLWALQTDVEFKNDTLNVRSFNLFEQPSLSDRPPLRNKDTPINGHGELKVIGSIVGLTHFLDGQNSKHAKMDLSGSWNHLGWPLNTLTKDISSNGTFTAAGIPEDFKVTAQASGEAYQKAITARTEIHVVDQTAEINMLKLHSGSSSVDVSGRFADKLALAWNISSPDLSELLPGSSGDLVSSGKLDGSVDAPRFLISAKSSMIDYNDLQLRNLNLIANGLLNASPDTINIDARVEQVKQGSTELAKDLVLTVNGSGQSHTLSINSMLLGRSAFSLNSQGSINQDGWKGRLINLSLDDPEYKKWELKQAVEVAIEKAVLLFDQTCLSNKNQSICMTIAIDDTALSASGEVQEFELGNLNPLLSLYDASLSGTLNGNFSYDKKSNDVTSLVNADFKTTNSIVSIKQANGKSQSLVIESINIALIQNQTMTANTTVLLENEGEITAEIAVASVFESTEFLKAELKGQVISKLNDLSKFQALAGPLHDLKGSLNADIKLTGSLSAPAIDMQTQLNNGEFKVPELGMSLNQIELSAKSNNKQKIIIDGQVMSGDGVLNMSGDLDHSQFDRPQISIALKGDNIELMNTHEVHVDGNIDAQIVITDELVDLNGNISLVHADLDFQLPENAILASEDVVLLGEEQARDSSQQKIRLKIDLGDQTHIRAQGLDANLVGSLELQQEPGGVMRANGQIDIKDGRYAAYNQKLKIDKGQLIYNGGPIDDPSLVLRAQKSIDSITAGVSVSGTADSPNLALYSTPSMSDQDILSVLIFDKKLGGLASQDGLTLLRIANSLRGDGASKSQVDVLTQNIQESLGLSNLELQLNGNSPSLTAGKQLSSKFYIGYGYGLLDAAQSLILRYKIGRSWSIQGDLGVDSGADLRYQIER